MNWSKLAQLILGVFLGLAFIAGGLTIAGYFYFSQFSKAPPKPTFPNDDKAAVTPKIAAYEATVSYQNGLFLRPAPSTEAKAITVLDYRQPVRVVDISSDKKWQKVELELEKEDKTQSLVGWIGVDNIERVESGRSDE
ncbi:MAG: SH3 domain-containing protein [Cyanobacteria bacterium P01_A01_bin.17]